ncbi:hypothetical protein [Streptomyces sp. NPDC001741]|uniref:hypothetical protein n=1 Tax=Streptomyces sp. NPDC001741 TaxID=3364605 RepID=UPI0036B21E09
MTGSLTLAQRRTQVRELAQGGASNRRIATKLGISKDTVARDLRATEAPPAEPIEAPVEEPAPTFAQRLAHRRTQTETAMRQLSAAAQAIDAARPAYTPADEETALRWYGELRAVVAQLTACADAFADYYPDAAARARTCATSSAGAPQACATDEPRPMEGGHE